MTKILVIDDDAAVRAALVQMLEEQGYAVVSAEDGRRGLKVFRAERPDLTITDILMPEQEGIQTIVEIRAAQPDAKIIAISGGGRIGYVHFLEVARRIGAADAIAKPFDPDDFLRRVARCLAAE